MAVVPITTPVKLFAPTYAGGTIQTANSGNVFVAADGTVTVNASDVSDLLKLGFTFVVTAHRVWNTPGAPAAPVVAGIVSSVGFSNGTLTIAAQPDVPRQLAIIVTAYSSLTAGALALVYNDNQGGITTDTFTFAGQATGPATVTTTKGVEHLTSATVSAVSGGTSPGVQIGTNGYIALPMDPRAVDFAGTKETKITPTVGSLGLSVPADETVSTLTTTNGLISPTQAVDGTHQFSFGYNYNYPA
jgi:hypothetical protein